MGSLKIPALTTPNQYFAGEITQRIPTLRMDKLLSRDVGSYVKVVSNDQPDLEPKNANLNRKYAVHDYSKQLDRKTDFHKKNEFNCFHYWHEPNYEVLHKQADGLIPFQKTIHEGKDKYQTIQPKKKATTIGKLRDLEQLNDKTERLQESKRFDEAM